MKEIKKFKVIECRGTQYEIGRQYGESCREKILHSIAVNLEAIPWLPIPKEQIIATSMKFLAPVQQFDPELIEFLKGEADGAGISFEEAFALRCYFEVAMYYGMTSALCTSFAATGSATVGGKILLGQNVDWFVGFPLDVLKIEHANGMKQLALSFGGVAEYTMNSYGLGMCANLTLAPAAENYQLTLPFGCYMPKVMRQKNIGDALGVLCQTSRGIGYVQLASGEGDIIGFESTFDDFNVLYPEKEMMVHSNHYLTERFKKGDWGYMVFPDSYLRVQRLKTLMEKQYGKITPEIMMELLSDHHNYPSGICRHANPDHPAPLQSVSVASFIMLPGEGKMLIAYGNPCEKEFVEYYL